MTRAIQCKDIADSTLVRFVAEAWDRGMSFSAGLLNGEEYTPLFSKANPYRTPR